MRTLNSLAVPMLALLLTGCFNEETTRTYTIQTTAETGGSISPPTTTAQTGEVVRFFVDPDENYRINEVTGCDGYLNNNLYFTAPMKQDCEITATFLAFTVDLPDRETNPEIDATISVDPQANYAFIPGSVRFTPTTGPNANLPAPLPEGVTPSSSLLEYSVQLENPGDTATVTITYDEPIGLGHRPMKFGPPEPGAEPTWFEVPSDMYTYGEDGRSIDLTITDGGIGDRDGEVNGVIDDPFLMVQLGDGINVLHTSEYGEELYRAIINVSRSFLFQSDQFLSFFYNGDIYRLPSSSLPSTVFTVLGPCEKVLEAAAIDSEQSTGVRNVVFLGINFTDSSRSCTIVANHPDLYRVSTESVSGVSFSPEFRDIHRNLTTAFNVSIPEGVVLEGISGCDGATLNESKTIVAVPNVLEDCTLTPVVRSYTVTAAVDGGGGSITPPSRAVQSGSTTSFALTPAPNFQITSVTGCGGSLSGNTYTTGPINADCQVTAFFNEITYTVSTSAGEGGTISPTSSVARTNETVSFTISPQTGYQIDTVTGCSGSLAGSTYTTGPVMGNCTVSAAFALQSFTVTASAGTGGTITPSSRAVDYNSTATFTVSPNVGYQVDSVTGCAGQFNSATNTFTTGAITVACHVSATFETTIYNLTGVSRGNGSGSVTPSSPTVEHGQSASFTITPNEHSTIGEITTQGCSGELSGNTYSIASVENDCTVTVDFDLITYSVSLNQTGEGIVQNSISTDVFPVNVGSGNSLNIIALPSNGFSLGSIQGCGVTLSDERIPGVDLDIYVTEPITADCTIDIVFEANEYQVSAIVTNTAGGSVDVTSPTVLHGGDVSFNVTLNDGYQLSAPSIPEGCGALKTALGANPIVIGPVTTDNCAFEFVFELKQYTVNFNKTGEGFITDVFFQPIPDSIQVSHGQVVGLFVAAATGYNLASAEGCGGFTQNPAPATIGLVSAPVVEDCTVEIVFELNQYQITTSVDNGGSWDPETASFTHGQETPVEFTLTVPDGYEVNSVTGCDYSVSGLVYSLGGITADCSLNATLKLQLDAPTVITVNPSDSAVTLIWSSVPNADSYKIYYAKESIVNVENYASLEGSGVQSFNDTIGSILGLENGVEHFFRVTTVQGAFESEGSVEVSATPVGAGLSAGGLNDTGAMNCASATSANVGCPNVMVPNQDAEHGRDKELADNNLSKEGAGAGSLDLTKLNAGGVALTVQDQAWDNSGNEIVGTQWSCVRDNVTGLVWDSRVSDATNYRHNENFYTWYNTNGAENGGEAGSPEDTAALPPFECVDGICNTESYVAQLNANAHCGFTDWRLPTMPEMYDLFGSAHRLDTDYFPHIVPMTPYWTSNTVSSLITDAFCMIPGLLQSVSQCPKVEPGLVMPVRAEP